MSKRKMRMCAETQKTFEEGVAEYILDCKSRNLRDGTIRHYRESIKQIYKRVPADTLISDMDEYTVGTVELRSDLYLVRSSLACIPNQVDEDLRYLAFVGIEKYIVRLFHICAYRSCLACLSRSR